MPHGIGSWQFVNARKAGVSQDPTQGEFFAPEEGLGGALVREAVQNSLDAQDQTRREPVRLRFNFGLLDDQTYPSGRYLSNLHQHLVAQELATLPSPGTRLRYLAIEDFGTRGLEGDPLHSIYDEKSSPEGERNDFYYFWRNVGRSVKIETARGRWGLGKAVFPVSSRINSFWGITVRKSDQRTLLMGQSVGRMHSLTVGAGDIEVYEAYGYYGLFDQDGFAHPIEDGEQTSRFIADFQLERNSGSGFSVVIPFPKEELNPELIIREVIRSYYIPVIAGQLCVEAGHSSQTNYALDRANIVEVTRQLDWTESDVRRDTMVDLIRFAEKVLEYDSSQKVIIGPPASRGAPSITEERFAPELLETLKTRLESGELLALRVPLVVKRGRASEASFFDAFLQKDDSLNSGIGEFVRQGLAISQIRKSPKQPVRALLLVDDKPLSTLLGDSENPAHTKWQERSEKIKPPFYESGAMTVRMCVNSLQRLSDLLSQRPESKDEDLLTDVFYVPKPEEEPGRGGGPQPKEDETGTSESPEVTVEPRFRAFKLAKIPGGFRVTGVAEASERPTSLSIQVAYAVRSGNPFTKYRPFDFQLPSGKIHLKGKGGRIRDVGSNTLIFDIEEPDFVLQLTEFDPNRDLEVRVVPLTIEVADEEADA